MKILVLNGSPHMNGATSDMVSAFSSGVTEAGHEVQIINVAHKKIGGCMACEYCHEKEKGVCVQKDDMQEIYPEILSADMLVFASPIYYFTLSAQLQAVIHQTYSIDIPKKVKMVALIMSSGSAYVYGPAIMNGIGNGKFSPEDTFTRAQLRFYRQDCDSVQHP